MITLTTVVLALCTGLQQPQNGDPTRRTGNVRAAEAAHEAIATTFEVRLKTGALARGNDVLIGELADVTPIGDEALAIGNLAFGPAPIPGYARAITRTEILQKLAAAGYRADQFVFRGATEALVQAVTIDIPANRLVEEATVVLQAVLALEGGDVEFDVDTRVRNVQAAPGRRSQEFRARVRGGATHPTSAVVDVQVMVDGEVHKTVPVTFRLTRYRNVLKTIGSIRAGTPLGPENVTVSREPAAQASGLLVTDFEQIAGGIARRDLASGRLLTLADVGAPALIRRGDVVTVVLTRGRIKVTARAFANHDAARDEPITVTNPDSGTVIRGVAAAPGTVVVPTR